jgi:hypothetical protein
VIVLSSVQARAKSFCNFQERSTCLDVSAPSALDLHVCEVSGLQKSRTFPEQISKWIFLDVLLDQRLPITLDANESKKNVKSRSNVFIANKLMGFHGSESTSYTAGIVFWHCCNLSSQQCVPRVSIIEPDPASSPIFSNSSVRDPVSIKKTTKQTNFRRGAVHPRVN